MFAAICACPPEPVAKYKSAPGARSWTISSSAVPSSPLPACPGSTVTRAGTSPEACRSASVLTPFEITPIPMPVPSTLWVVRAEFARWATSPEDVFAFRVTGESGAPARRGGGTAKPCVRVLASSAGRMVCTAGVAASNSIARAGTRARMARYFGTLLTTVPPRARIRARLRGVTSARMSTRIRSSAGSAGDASPLLIASATRVGLSNCPGRPPAAAACSSNCELTLR